VISKSIELSVFIFMINYNGYKLSPDTKRITLSVRKVIDQSTIYQ